MAMPRVEQQDFVTQKTARVFHLKPTENPKGIVIAIHGYRQLPQFFIRKFQTLVDQGFWVIAPEGLSRFYIEGYSGRVGASWMTKEERETDIKDYINYLNSYLTELKSTLKQDLPIHLLGFSQGGATASRWFASSNFEWASFTLYASIFPNDFDFEGQQGRVGAMPFFLLFGNNDQFADEKTIQEKIEWLNQKGFYPEVIRFVGGHDIYPEVLEKLAMKIGM